MAEALVGGAFLAAGLQVLFDRMASRDFVNFFRGRKHNDRIVLRLKATLLTIQIVLDDAENKQLTNTAVKDWLDELQDVLYHADDLLDEISTHQAQEKSSTKNILDLISSSTNTFHEEVESKIKDIIDRLDYFAKHKDVLGLKEATDRPKFMYNRLPSTCLVDEIGICGRDNDKEKIISLLLTDGGSEDRISVIPIVGMGGIGKTTLAQLVYNDARVGKYFSKKAWVCVSDQFDIFRVTKTILEAVTLQACNIKQDLNQLQVEMENSLRGQKFLFILDDIWNESSENWDLLQRPFRAGEHGSKVIVTTRIASIASMMQTIPSHHMRELSEGDCWSLFSKSVFRNGDPTPHPDLEVIGKKIVKKCGGLPLAAKTLAGLLRSNLDIRKWDYILKSEIWDFPNSKSNIIPALRLSYHHLPSRLKRCFAYCSIFPKDCEFQKEELVLLWMAEKLLPQKPKTNMTMEEVGDECFRELLSRSFFQQSFGKESCFVMHDLVNDLAQFISGDFCFRLEDNKHRRDIPDKVRHFSYLRHRRDSYDNFKELNINCLRTFLPFKHPSHHVTSHPDSYLMDKVLNDMLPMLRCLRVLSLSHYCITELPHSISNLKLLRYLDVSCTKIKWLPESVTTLFNLQTLLLSNCKLLSVLPREMRKLVCLRHLDLNGTSLIEMPDGMDRLKSLQFLSTFVVGKHRGSGINVLGQLCHLQKSLSILGLQNVINAREAIEANLEGKKQLDDLVLEWGTCTVNFHNQTDILEKLRPPTNLKTLSIKNYGGERLPSWIGEHLFKNMVSLNLESCGGCLLFPPLGQLQSLKILTIKAMERIRIVGPEFCGDDSLMEPFQSLEILRFDGMTNWEEWHILGTVEFPCLQELYIVNCPKLTGNLPNKIVSLRRLEISGCRQLVPSLPNGSVTILCMSSLQKLLISDIQNLGRLPQELSKLKYLEEVHIRRCGSLESFGEMELPSLKILKIQECDSLKSLPEGMTRFQELSISQCSSLLSLSSCMLQVLKKLNINDCRDLELPDEMEPYCYTSIERLTLHNSCRSLKSLPLGLYPNLLYLKISACTNFMTISIPKRFRNQLRLQYFGIRNCPNVVSFLDGRFPGPELRKFSVHDCENIELLPSFQSLQPLSISIIGCHKLMAFRTDWGLQRLHSLRTFEIEGAYEKDLLTTFPEEWLFPSSLFSLYIWNFPNLKSLNQKGLQHLNSIDVMIISNCPQLESLPEEALPSSLTQLYINYCPLLKPRCQRGKGQDWHKIAHIPFIQIDDEVIF